MTAGEPPVAELISVCHRYGAALALDDVTVSFPPGGMTGLIGPDGVGKSTLLGLVAGVRRLQSGAVSALGGDMDDASHRRAVCPRIAYMPQGLGRNLYPTLSVYENVDFFGRLFGQSQEERRWRIDELLRGVGLDPFPDRPAGKLSGGMKQKLSLCCSLVHDPDLLILDEPTTGVDPLSRKQFWELIDRLRARRPGMSVITATAYMEEARRFDHLIAMDAGRLLAVGSPDDLIARSGAASLEDAFIALLPEERRRDHRRPLASPFVARDRAPAIEAERLTKRFGGFVAVDDVTVRVERGEIFGFLGSNGCGKTTTMKMLTGLLQPTLGVAKLFGQAAAADGSGVLERVGYMSQSFSLYSELTVRQNLDLHARLFHLPRERIAGRVEEMLARFDLVEAADALPESQPLGVRQRLQLAVAVIHSPDMLILDEPTSGVDPIARDRFWELLLELSRRDGVTIFISTHYVNEAERCDRISLMHAGRILAMGKPDALREARGAATLEEAFIGCLEDAAGDAPPSPQGKALSLGGEGWVRGPFAPSLTSEEPKNVPSPNPLPGGERVLPAGERGFPTREGAFFSFGRLWAFARRETIELARDPIRIAFALLGPLILATAMVLGISFDIEDVRYAALDGDRSQESQSLLDNFSSSRYFLQRPPASSYAELDQRLQSGDIRFALVIPPGYGRDLQAGRQPEIGVWLDGSNTFRAETARGYVQGMLTKYYLDLSRRESGVTPVLAAARVETRFRYNQAFLSRNAISPGVLMMLIVLFSAMLTALGVVREKELGSIINFYAAPARKLEFLMGKQIPYVGVAFVSFLSLTFLIRRVFDVPMTGGFFALALGAVLFAVAATAFGLVVSLFVRSQIAAIFGSAIIVMIPALNFSGMLYPVSTLEGSAWVIGTLFPAYYFQQISSGVFNKGLGLAQLYPNHLALVGFCLAFWAISALMLKKQEA
jgi:ribosome-dependent ATPase